MNGLGLRDREDQPITLGHAHGSHNPQRDFRFVRLSAIERNDEDMNRLYEQYHGVVEEAPDDAWLTVDQVARLAKRPPGAIANEVRSGHLPKRERKDGTRVVHLIKAKDARAYVASRAKVDCTPVVQEEVIVVSKPVVDLNTVSARVDAELEELDLQLMALEERRTQLMQGKELAEQLKALVATGIL